MTVFPEEIEKEYQEMAFAVEHAQRGCWLFAVYNQATAREQIIKRLQTETKLPIFTWQYDEGKPYPIDYLHDLTEQQQQQRAVVMFINTADGGEKIIKSLDFNREKFAKYPHSLIFWVTERERGEIARQAGHFWVQRRGTFDFSALVLTATTQNNSYGSGDWLNNLLNIDDYREASRQLDFYRQIFSEYPSVEQASPNIQRLIAETADKISCLLYYLGRYSEAVGYCRQALSLYRALSGENDYPVLAACNNLALLYLRSGLYDEVEPLLQKTLLILERRSDYVSAMATVLNNLAELYKAQGKYSKAESLYQKSLAIREQALGKNHPDVTDSLNNLAALYYDQGKYAQAEPLYRKSLTIREQVLGQEHPDVASSLNNLALLYGAQGKYTKAAPLYQKSLAIFEKTLSTDHTEVATSLNNLAVLYSAQGEYVKAEPLYQKSLAIWEKTLGTDHPNVAISLNNLAELYSVQDKCAQAEPLYQRSLAILEKTLGADHPDTKQVKVSYEQLLAKKAT